MNKNSTWCAKVSDDVNYPKCNEKKVIKNGRTKNYKQPLSYEWSEEMPTTYVF
jgi:hypothetical protein